MDYSERYKMLDAQFILGKNCYIPDSDVDIRFFPFDSKFRPLLLNSNDELIGENTSFVYPVFSPAKKTKSNEAIVLLHGLNERRWNKYLPWAEFLAKETGKSVILFPIAFHMNRSPYSWSNPREMDCMLNVRRMRNGDDRFLTVANVALSERICEQPLRFYVSGKQSIIDLNELLTTIKQGQHPLFDENTQIDFFAYSIGAFLSQVALIADDSRLYSDSKLFMFCGGSIFSSMSGKSRSILDETAFDTLLKYYLDTYPTILFSTENRDKVSQAFCSMIAPQWFEEERFSFFKNMGKRVSGISLKKDTVIPHKGIMQAMGGEYTDSRIQSLDFDYNYLHESPFPLTGKIDVSTVNTAFDRIFSEAAQFLA